MKSFLIYLFIIFFIINTAYSQKYADTTIISIAKKLLEQDQRDSLKKLGYQIQNRGFILEEIEHDHQGALEYIDQALLIWTVMKDTAKEANLRKYKGMLLGYLHQFPEAKAEVRRAIYLFKEIKTKYGEYGIAVSHLNFSKIYEEEGHMDSAYYFAHKALEFWETKDDTSRVLANRNHLMNLHIKAGNYEEAKAIQKKSEELIDCKERGCEYPILDFYYLSARLYGKLENVAEQNKYQELYSNKVEEIKTSGRDIKSKYDIN